MSARGEEHGAPGGQGSRRSAGHRATEPRTGATPLTDEGGAPCSGHGEAHRAHAHVSRCAPPTYDYRYGADGQRAIKYSTKGESLYFDPMWQCQTDYPSLREMKNIYVGQSRVASQMSISGDNTTSYENVNTYYYHPDHLGSSQLITDYQGKEYERVEYTAYGESWIEKETDSGSMIPYKFTGKEKDTETGLYYYGARYYNPRTSAWISADPALGDYLPVAPVDDDARKHNGNLPGIGGVFNLVNLAVYHYAGNSPVRYTDPNGKVDSPGEDARGKPIPAIDGIQSYEEFKYTDNAEKNKGQNYQSGKNDCDIWLENNTAGTKIDLVKGWGAASSTTADGHKGRAGKGQADPSIGLNFVVMQDTRAVPAKDKVPSHVVSVFLKSDGSVKVYEMDRPESYSQEYSSVEDFKKDYLYNTFTFYPASMFTK